MSFFSNSVNVCLPSVSIDRHFSFPYFEKCGDIVPLCVVTTLFSVVIRIRCGDISLEKTKRKIANSLIIQLLAILVVVPPGIEPGTQGFSVLCSTN